MAVLIIKNIETEGPGTIEQFLRNEEIPFHVVELGIGEIPPGAGTPEERHGGVGSHVVLSLGPGRRQASSRMCGGSPFRS